MPKSEMKDIIVVLPGITGSVLAKDNKELWNWSVSSVFEAAKTLGGSLQELVLKNDGGGDIADDGVVATRMMDSHVIIPKFVKIDGYDKLRDFLLSKFDLVKGEWNYDFAANYFEFPYDWRRDNRHSAKLLKKVTERALHKWRKEKNPEAKLILIGHSMGGLVSRYFIECLEGWKDTKALITLGTPYRGSLNAVDGIANGIKKGPLDLTDLMRSLPSAYQLLPIYPVLSVGDKVVRLREYDKLNEMKLSQDMFNSAKDFHKDIEDKVDQHMKKEAAYNYQVLPVVGVNQLDTNQSILFEDGKVNIGVKLPPNIKDIWIGGDSTVPKHSAIPVEYSDKLVGTYIAERHGSLQRNPAVFNYIENSIYRLQSMEDLKDLHGGEAVEQGSFSLCLEDAYVKEPVGFSVQIVNGKDQKLQIDLENLDTNEQLETITTQTEDGKAFVNIPECKNGAYRIRVASTQKGPAIPPPIHDIFLVNN